MYELSSQETFHSSFIIYILTRYALLTRGSEDMIVDDNIEKIDFIPLLIQNSYIQSRES